MARLEIDLSVRGLNESVRGFDTFSKTLESNISLHKQLSDRLKEVQANIKSGKGDYNNLKQSQEQIRQAVLGLNREMTNQTRVLNSNDGSLVQLRSRLNLLRQQYDSLSSSQRNNTTATRGLVDEIRALNAEISKGEQATGRFQRNVGNYGSALSTLSPSLGLLTGTGAGLLAVAMGARDAYKTISTFDSGLRNVEKTTGLTRVEIEQLGKEFIQLSRTLKTVSTNDLTQYATIAGQLGVKGTRDILAFTEALAKLETASNISGEEGGAEIARTLTLIDGGVQNVKAFGDEIVNLGNNFAATEKEILSNAESIAQNVGIYKIGRQDVLAFATATKSVGIEAELVGSTFNRTLAIFESAIRTGDGVKTILNLIGGSEAELAKRFKTDAAGVFVDFIGALNRVYKEGGSVNEQLEALSINAVRDQRVIQSLAANGYDVLTRALETAKNATGALDAEFETASGKMEKQVGRVKIAWDNLVLSIESGTGAVGKFSIATADVFASILEGITNIVTSTSWKEFFARFGELSGNRGISLSANIAGTAIRQSQSGSGQNGLTTYSDLKDFYRLDEAGRRKELAAQEKLVEYQSKEFLLNKENLKIRDSLLFNAEKLAKMRQVLATPVSAQNNSTIVGGGGSGGLGGGGSSKGKSQSELIKEANEALSKGQVDALRGIDSQLLKIDNKYQSIFEKINKITDKVKRDQLLALANANKELEISNTKLDALVKTYNKIPFSSTRPGRSFSLPSISQEQLDKIGKDLSKPLPVAKTDFSDKDLEKRLGRVVERGLRRGIDDIFSNIDSLGSNFYDVFSNVFTKLSKTVSNTFGQVISTQLGDLLGKSINSEDFRIGGLNANTSKATVAVAGILGSALMAQGSRKANYGAAIGGGAISGAATGFAVGNYWGAAIGAVVGALSGLFSAGAQDKQNKIAEAQLEEQKKQTALQQRAAALSYSSQIIGQKVNEGFITSVDRDATGRLVATIKGSDIQLALDRTRNSR